MWEEQGAHLGTGEGEQIARANGRPGGPLRLEDAVHQTQDLEEGGRRRDGEATTV